MARARTKIVSLLYLLLLMTPGILCVAVAVSANYIGFGNPGSGFNWNQVFLLIIGLALLLCGVLAGKKRRQSVPAEGQLPLKRKVIHSGIVTVVFGIIAFSTLELYVRMATPHLDLWVLTGRKSGRSPMARWAQVDAFCAYRGRPGQYSGSFSTKTINQHGFISTPEISFDKEPNEIRLVFLGGSATAGTGKDLPDQQTWPWKVAEDIKKRLPDKKITFINAAVGGYSSFESYGRLWSRVRFFQPDIVVVYHGWNEMYYFDNADTARTWRTRSDGSWGFDRATPLKICEPMWLDHFLQYSQTLTRVRRSLALKGQGEIGGSEKKALVDDFDHRAAGVWSTNLELLRETCKVLDAELFVCKQATLMVPELPDDQRARCDCENHGFDYDAHLEAYREIYRTIDEQIPASQVIDLTELSGRPELFHDHVHPTEDGTTAIAAIVAECLVRYIEHGVREEPQESASK